MVLEYVLEYYCCGVIDHSVPVAPDYHMVAECLYFKLFFVFEIMFYIFVRTRVLVFQVVFEIMLLYLYTCGTYVHVYVRTYVCHTSSTPCMVWCPTAA